MSRDGDDTAAQPVLRVVRGDPSPEELAALIAVVTSRGSAVAEPVPERSRWSVPVLRAPLSAGPGAWTASAFRA